MNRNLIKKPKVAVIGLKGLPAFGGAATVGENIIRELVDEFDFYVYSISSHTDKKGEINGYTQIVFRKSWVKKINVFLYYIKSAFHCMLNKYDLIHLHHTDGAFILPILRLKYKVILTSHAQPQINEKWPGYVKIFFSFNEKIALRLSNDVTAVSMPLTNLYKAKTTKTIHYIPNGINLDQEIENEIIDFQDYILFAAGRIIPLKGLHLLLEAMKETNFNKKLLVVGDLEQLPAYKEKIINLADGLDVKFLPLIREKAKLLNYVKNADLFVFPSYSENMSIMLLEVAYCKTPVICSDIDANKAIFSDEEVLFFKSNDSSDLAEKLSSSSKSDNQFHARTEKAYEKLKEDFNWQAISKQYKSLFQNSLK